MKRWLGNIFIRLILNADKGLKAKLFDSLEMNNSIMKFDSYKKKYKISSTFRFNGKNIKFYGDGEIICKENSYIGDYSTIQSAKNCSVIIGNNCSISHNVRIYTSSNEANQNMNTIDEKVKVFGDVIIGNGVWIGANVFINPNIIIGDNVIVGANSVVSKNLETNGVYGGVPAKLIRFKNG